MFGTKGSSVLRPASEAELSDTIRAARGPLALGGGFTRGAAVEGERLTTAALAGIVLHEPGALTLVAQAGTPLAEVERVLGEAGQRLAFEPQDLRALLGTAGSRRSGGRSRRTPPARGGCRSARRGTSCSGCASSTGPAWPCRTGGG
jgi:FAD/FMN-containing dehydrogenase